MYESPIRLLVQQLETSIREQQEKQIFEAVQKCGVDVDREELIKALAYDRDQHDKGYADGRADAQRWISVEERLPDIDAEVLIYTNKGLYDLAQYSGGERFWTLERNPDCWVTALGVTHWMLLPQPPEEES